MATKETKYLDFTDDLIKGLVPAEKPYAVWDTLASGLSCSIQPSGRTSYVVHFNYKRPDGTRVSGSISLGDPRKVTVAGARKATNYARALVAQGTDPRDHDLNRIKKLALTASPQPKTKVEEPPTPTQRNFMIQSQRAYVDRNEVWLLNVQDAVYAVKYGELSGTPDRHNLITLIRAWLSELEAGPTMPALKLPIVSP